MQIDFKCPNCGKHRSLKASDRNRKNFTGLCKPCYLKNTRGEKHGKWKGGKFIDKFGYMLILKRDHPLADGYGYIREHRLVASNKWGVKSLIGMVVHHKDGDRLNNNIENLQIMSMGDHSRLHFKGKPRNTAKEGSR